ncbi:MAG: prefoldin subunit alpha [Candidatus Nanoarchaeia archaeon]
MTELGLNQQTQQELMFKLSMFEQQIQNLQQQLQAVEQSITDLEALRLGLDDLSESKGKEIFAPVGRGIFTKAKIISEEFTVDVGGNNLVKKTVHETKNLLLEQVKKLESIKKEINEALERTSEELQKTLEEAQKKQEKKKGE